MKNLFSSYKKSINPPYSRNDFFVLGGTFFVLLVAFIAVISLPSSYNDPDGTYKGQAAAANEFLATFDGDPTSPRPAGGIASKNVIPDWDVQIHSRDCLNLDPNCRWLDNNLDPIDAGHGPDCSAPPATHNNTSYEGSVFNCRNHLMTAINGPGYAAIMLTPNRMLDWTNGAATFSFDMSTHVSSSRDWVDIWLSPFNNALVLPTHLAPDLNNDAPRSGEWLQIVHAGRTFIPHNHNGTLWGFSSQEWQADSKTQRDKFELTIDRTNMTMCKVSGEPNGQPLCFYKDLPHGINFTKAVVQIGHHSYTPTKGGCVSPSCPNPNADSSGTPNTWHWDNFYMSNAVPFTLIHTNKRIITTGGQGGQDTITFDSPAPTNSFLRFTSQGQVSVNGQVVQSQVPSTSGGSHANHFHVPIPQGSTTATIKIECIPGAWYCNGWPFHAKDFHIWSETTTGGTQPTATSVPVTSTPIPTSAPSATPTSTPTPTPTRTPTPVPPTSTPTVVSLRGDINRDGTVNIVDFSILLADWAPVNNLRSDLNSDGQVGIADFSILLSNWTN